MKLYQIAAVCAAAVLIAGCDQQRDNQRADSQGGVSDSSKKQVDDAAERAKEQVDAQAKAQKQRIEAEQKAAQAQLEAQQAQAKLATNNADAQVNAASQQIRDAVGNASSRVQSQTGTVSSGSGANASSTSATNNTDQGMTERIRKALGLGDQSSTSTSGRNVQVNVSNGTVTLSGTVSSDQEKQQMETSAKAIPGVTEVKNNIEVKNQ